MPKKPSKMSLTALFATFACGLAVVNLGAKGDNGDKAGELFQKKSLSDYELSSSHAPATFDLELQKTKKYKDGSILVKRPHTVVRLGPTNRTKRRGVVMKGQRLPFMGSVEGPGCGTTWYNIHTDSWICGDFVEQMDLPPDGKKFPIIKDGEITPWSFGFVREPTMEYSLRGGVLLEERELLKGFGFGVAGRVSHDGVRYLRTVEGTLVPRQYAGVTGRISKFVGMMLEEEPPWPIGFVNSKNAWVYSVPKSSKENRVGKVDRYQAFVALEESGEGRKKFVKFDEGGWISKKDVRIATKASAPEGIGENEKWIDVDTKQQIVTAYEGKNPVYITLTSTGRVGPSHTVLGTYRIWVKVSAIAMDNTDEELEEPEDMNREIVDAGVPDERKLYSLHDVPWVQFFFESYGIHGVYWHDRFGNRRSHGCVNLAPIDARWFFDWSHPVVPDGWWAIHTSPNDKGTIVRVR